MFKYLQLIRVKHWTKNFFCFAGIIFGAEYFNLGLWIVALLTFFSFSFISSSFYVLNDIIDKKADSLHPTKKKRPIASGTISAKKGMCIAIVLLLISIFLASTINKWMLIMIGLYFINNIFYNLIFKKTFIIDVLSISFGFILRLCSGIYAVGLTPSAWIVICTFFLAMFLGFSKRRAEFIRMENSGDFLQRPVLKKYSLKILDSLINETSFGAVLTYSLFCILSKDNPALLITLPIVYFAVMYYRSLLYKNLHGEEPETIILKDKVIFISVILWLTLFILVSNYKINILS